MIVALTVGISSIIAALIAVFANHLAKKKKTADEDLKHLYTTTFNEFIDGGISNFIPPKIDAKTREFYETLFRSLSNKTIPERNFIVHAPTYPSKEQIEERVKEQLSEIKKRIESIEKRFPKDSKLEKLASVNDAILATNIENLSETVQRIEKKLLSKWDVAKIVFQILAALGVIVAIIFGVLQYIGTKVSV